MVKISDENCKSFWNMLLGRLRKITPPSPPVPKDEVLKDVGHSMSIGNLHLGVNSVTALLWFIMKVYYKMRYLLQITLFNLITGRREVEAIPKLRKNCSPFTLFSFINNPLSNGQTKVLNTPSTPFCSPNPF